MNEIDEIFTHIDAKENFLLSGGAGSGKTYTLVKVLQRIFENDPKASVACITYTNVAVHEINDRVQFTNMRVSTIHDFLWDNIKFFQKNLKKAVIELVAAEKISYSGEEAMNDEFLADKSIDYKEWKSLKDGIISHDEIILIAEYLFQHNPLMGKILKDKFDFILVDEYQDTSPEVINILLEYLPASVGSNVLGFFGDSMQSIYNGAIGDIKKYIDSGLVKEVLKKDNRRNPSTVIELANKLRTDNVQQASADDEKAPNYHKAGTVKFLFSRTEIDIDAIKQSAHFTGWNFADSVEIKELYLTHNLIAPKAGFPELMRIYDADKILDIKYDASTRIKEGAIVIPENATFGDVVTQLNIQPTGVKKVFIDEHPDLYQAAKQYPWELFKKIYLDKDQLIGNKKGTSEEERKRGTKRDYLVRHLFHIQECIYLYDNRKFNEFIRHTGFIVHSVQSKIDLKDAIETLKGMIDSTIEEVIDYADEKAVWKKDDKFCEFVAEKEYVYNRVKKVTYREFYNLYKYVEGYTPFSTQHNIKGAEFNNVFVVLDNGRWNLYHFGNMLVGTGGADTVRERTRKLFYVCCTRTKENLVIYYSQPTAQVLTAVQGLIGQANMFEI